LAERRRNRLSIAIPASMVSEHRHLRDKTEALGRVGRAAAIYRVEEIIVYPDQPDESTLMKYILGYMETPQYLRKRLFDRRPELRYVGTLPPLRTPHHPLGDSVEDVAVGEAREGVVTNVVEGGYMVDVGLDRLMEVRGRSPSRGSRVTVQILEKEPALRGRPVKKSMLGTYWGYDLRGSNYRLYELALSPEWDLTIATSRKGDDFNSAAPEIGPIWAESRRTLVAFGSHSEGVYEIIGREGKRAEECFRFIINTVPRQGTETVRTEEAVHATLALLNTFKD
jgi:predicted SPOUT superfamily RNA methylase MTH1